MRLGKEKLVISVTEADTGLSCYRKYFVGSALELHRGYNSVMSFGTVLHEGIGAFHQDPTLVGKVLMETYNKEFAEIEDVGELTVEKAMDILNDYNLPFCGIETPGYIPFAQEWRFRIQLPDIPDAFLSMQCDRVAVHEKRGTMGIVDTKTTSSRWLKGDKFEETWRRSLQMKIYQWGVQQIVKDKPVEWIRIEGVSRETPGLTRVVELPSYSREELEEAVGMVQAVAFRTAAINDMVKAGEMSNPLMVAMTDPVTVPPNYSHCEAYFRKCPLYEMCHEIQPSLRADEIDNTFTHIPREV